MSEAVRKCAEWEEYHGMSFGSPKVRYNCPCGFSTEWVRSQYKARVGFQMHANTCDTALWIFSSDPKTTIPQLR